MQLCITEAALFEFRTLRRERGVTVWVANWECENNRKKGSASSLNFHFIQPHKWLFFFNKNDS